jgi:uncharacterized protein YhbP (UPF0306 family)
VASIKWQSEPVEAQAALDDLLRAQSTAALAVMVDNRPWLCTVYFAAAWPDLYVTSQPSTAHVGALASVPTAAMAIWRRPERWGDPIAGVQLAGTCAEVEDGDVAAAGLRALHGRFPGMDAVLTSVSDVYGSARKTAMLRFAVDAGVVVDEARLGRRNFVSFELDNVGSS